MRADDHTPEDPEQEEWDVIVVGTGMGGGTFGYELARRGRRVLYLERGKFLHGGPQDPVQPHADADPEEEMRLLTGRWPKQLTGRTSFGPVQFFAPLGSGSAGTTGLYGAQLERFTQSDFQPRQYFPEAPDADLPEQWPVEHEAMTPYYRMAETLYRVCGTLDPLNPDPGATLREPPALSERDQVFHDNFVEAGLHPYRAHVGYQYVPNCYECSDICPLHCKSDAGVVCVTPAMAVFGARLLPECEVVELAAEGSRVTGVRARWQGREITLRGKTVALAAGSFMTPVILLNSRSRDWPDGLANRSGMVGRNLMLHVSDFLTLDPKRQLSTEGPTKSLALNDFYLDNGKKLGTFQTIGLPLRPEYVLAYLRYVEQRDPHWWRQAISRFMPWAANQTQRFFGRATLFATVIEDLPYRENRVVADPQTPSGMRYQYTYPRELRARSRQFRKRLRQTLGQKHTIRVVNWGANNLNYGHVCGTCRYGDDPKTSVLDPSNRAHDLDNLYVVDASFFPSSGGTNPSLTIAANAIRVAELVHKRLD